MNYIKKILILITIFIIFKQFKILEGFSLFYRCDKYLFNKTYKSTFKNLDMHETNDKNEPWDFYYPCGYTNLELELRKIKDLPENKQIFGIGGSDLIAAKDYLWFMIADKYGRDEASKLMPETCLLNYKKDLDLFKKNYNPNKFYILKKNLQRKQGILITKSLKEINKSIDDGFTVVQKYIDSYLIKNRKINLRLYILIICQNNEKQVFLNETGKCIYTNKDYDVHTYDKEVHITSYNLDQEVYDGRPLLLKELKEYFGEEIYNNLFDKIKLKLIKIFNASLKKLCKLKNIKKNRKFQLFGADLIFDNDYEPYLLEFNKGPDMNSKSRVDKKLKINLLQDIFYLLGISEQPEYHKNSFIKII
jgi:hypothetical protein